MSATRSNVVLPAYTAQRGTGFRRTRGAASLAALLVGTALLTSPLQLRAATIDLNGSNVVVPGGINDITTNVINSALGNGLLTFDVAAGSANMFGSILQTSGQISVEKIGLGRQNISNAANNYTGTTKITAGILGFGAAGSFGTGQVVLNGGQLSANLPSVTIANVINVTANSLFTSNFTTISSNMIGAGRLTIDAGSSLNLTGNNSGFSGGISFTNYINISNDNALGTGQLATGPNGSSGLGLVSGTTAVTLANAIDLTTGSTLAIYLTSATDSVRVDGVISGPGTIWLRDGAGTLVLAGANTQSNYTVATGGTLGIANSAAFGTSVLKIAASANPVTLLAVGGDYTFANPVQLAAALTVNTDGHDLAINGVVSNVGSLTKVGAGTLTLGGAVANTYGGGTFLNGGRLSISRNNQLGAAAGALTFNGGSLRVTGTTLSTTTRSIVFNGVGGFDIDAAANTFILGQVVSGPGGLLKQGAGTLRLSAANTFAGNSVLEAGTLELANPQGFGPTGIVTIDGATLKPTASIDLANDVVLASVETINTNGFDFTISGDISGVGGVLNKDGGGHLLLTGTNTYTGGTLLNNDAIEINNKDALGGGQVTMASGTTLFANADVTLLNTFSVDGSTIDTRTHDVRIDGKISNGQLIKDGTGALTLNNGLNDYAGGTQVNAGAVLIGANGSLGSGKVTLESGTRLGGIDAGTDYTVGNAITLDGGATIGDGSKAFILNGKIDGTGPLTKGNGQSLVLTGDNEYSGGTVVNGGTLVAGSNTAVGTAGVTMNNGSYFGSQGSVSLGALNTFLLNGAEENFYASNLTINGIVSGPATLVVLDQGGYLELTGTNTHAATTIGGGTLVIGNDVNLGDAAGALTFASINGDPTLRFSADTNVAHKVVMTDDGTVVLNGTNSEISGEITGSGGLRVLGTDGLNALTVSHANTGFTGTTAILDAIVKITNADALGTGKIDLQNGTVNTQGNSFTLKNAVFVGGGTQGAIDLNASGNLVLDGALSGGGDLTLKNGGTVTINNANAGLTGTVTAKGITLEIGDGGALGTAALTLNSAFFNNSGPTELTYGGEIHLRGANVGGGAGDLVLTGAITDDGTGSYLDLNGPHTVTITNTAT